MLCQFFCTECVNNCSVDFPKDCGEVLSRGEKTSGLYPIKLNGSEPFIVYCEFTEGKNTHRTHTACSSPTVSQRKFRNVLKFTRCRLMP